MAVSMGIYDKLIYSVTHLFSEFKKSLKFVLPIGIGMVVGIIGLSFIIEYLFDYFPIQTNLFFIGLILGGLPAIVAKVKAQPIRVPLSLQLYIYRYSLPLLYTDSSTLIYEEFS